MCAKSTIKTPERRRPGAFTVNFEHISRLSSVSIVDLALVNVGYDYYYLVNYGRFVRKH